MESASFLLPITNSNSAEKFNQAATFLGRNRKNKRSFLLAIKAALNAEAYMETPDIKSPKLEIIRTIPQYSDLTFARLGREALLALSGEASGNKGVRIAVEATNVQAVEFERKRYSSRYLADLDYFESLGHADELLGSVYVQTIHAWEFSGTAYGAYSAHGIVKPGGGGGVLELTPLFPAS